MNRQIHQLIAKGLFFLSIPFLLCTLGCSGDKSELPPKERYESLAKIIEKGIRNGDIERIQKRFSSGLLNRQLKKQISLGKGDQNEIMRLAETSFKSNLTGLTQQYGIENGGHFQLDSIFFDQEMGHFLFSAVGASGTVNFIDFWVEAYDHNIYIMDYLIYYQGIKLSDEIHNMIRGLLAQQSNVKGKMHNPYLEAIDQLEEVLVLLKDGDCEGAWEEYGKLNEKYQDHPLFLSWQMRIATCLSPEKYEELATKFTQLKEVYPQSKVYHELMVATYKNDLQLFDKASTKLKTYTGHSAEYDFLKARLFLKKEEPEAALTYIERCFPILDNAFHAHDARLDILMKAGKEREAYECLMKINELFELDSDYFNEVFKTYPQLKEGEELQENLMKS